MRQLYEQAETGLLVSNKAEAYIIFYAYTDFNRNSDRNLDSGGVRGTGLVFQDKDGILFMRFRFYLKCPILFCGLFFFFS